MRDARALQIEHEHEHEYAGERAGGQRVVQLLSRQTWPDLQSLLTLH